MKLKTKNKVILIAFLLFIILLICFYILKTNNYITLNDELHWRINSSKLSELKPMSDRYIISQVGESRFLNEFKFLPEKSQDEPSQKDETLKKYRIAYEYLTASKLSGEQEIIYVVLINGEVERAIGISNCIKEPSKCDFKINKNQAIEIARKNGFITNGESYSIRLSNSGSERGWLWVVSKNNPKGSVCPEGRSYSLLEINVIDGKVSPIRNEGYCP